MWTACGMSRFGWFNVLLFAVLVTIVLMRFWPLLPRADSAMTLLRERYARGDITREHFELMRANLEMARRDKDP